MKKFICGLSMALLTVILTFALAGCSKAGNIQKAYEDAGYTVSSHAASEDDLKDNGFSDEDAKNASSYAIYVVYDKATGKIPVATYIKYPSADKIKDNMTTTKDDGSKDTSAYDDAVEAGLINGDCVYIGVPTGDVFNIFKNA
ncbi:MAG: hypothetical protein K2O89_05225 [Clostridia bacterium]|nr:hypothetical protein [Clostridia bacterium]